MHDDLVAQNTAGESLTGARAHTICLYQVGTGDDSKPVPPSIPVVCGDAPAATSFPHPVREVGQDRLDGLPHRLSPRIDVPLRVPDDLLVRAQFEAP
jgi:hypothetical protein